MIVSCEKGFEPDFSFGKATAERNAESWKAQGVAKYNKPHGIGIDFIFDVFNEVGELRQRLTFGKVPIDVVSVALKNSSAQSNDTITRASFKTVSSDGDVLEDIYLVLEDSIQSHIEILSIDSDTNWIKGAFMATFIIDPNRPKFNPNNPDTIRFTNGAFEARIDKE